MFGLPLHPIVVHFPLVLSAFLPFLILVAWILGRRTASGRKFWLAVTVVQALLAATSFAAVQTGEEDEERVEKVLASEDPLETHEEKGELLFKVAGAGFLITALGLAPGMTGLAGRALGSLASLAILALALQVGHSGGKLVYLHGAAAAFSTAAGEANPSGAGARSEGNDGADGSEGVESAEGEKRAE